MLFDIMPAFSHKTDRGDSEMKKLMMMVAACLAATIAFSAQCEGKTQQGARCKRDAAEGSKFCIGHADQAKQAEAKKPAAKLKDDGTCWAVTEKGERCKHKKDGDKDYCKQHAADVKPSKPFAQCRAMTYDGTQCPRKPVEGGRYCKQHCK